MTKVLVVDDEKLVRWFVERALKKAGFEVITASSAKEAIKVLQENTIDILLTDIRMPEENGTYLIDKLVDFAQSPRTIVFSAFITPEMSDTLKDRGIETIRKPFKIDELLHAVKKCVNF